MSLFFDKATRPGGFFITGTDTDVGKTYAAGCVAHTLIQHGISVIPRKPIASGCIKQADNSLLSEDALFLQQSCESVQSLEAICPYQFEPALSPQTAIEQAGLMITTQDLINACHIPKTQSPNELYLVEGAGGFYSPLCSNGLNRDFAQALSYPVILVVKNQLGCINHTLLTLNAIEQAGLTCHAIILNHFSEQDFIQNYAKGLESWTELPIYRVQYEPSLKPQLIEQFKLT